MWWGLLVVDVHDDELGVVVDGEKWRHLGQVGGNRSADSPRLVWVYRTL